ncbi:MAG: 3-dehydroquinate synthase [Fibrobacter sp.]|nr:3-dehydroquinate synthase [Fibrobacter sp.]
MDIKVNLGQHSYDVTLEHGISSHIPGHLKKMFPESRFVLVTNEKLAGIYSGLISTWTDALGLSVHVIPDGEKFKTIETWSGVMDFLLQSRIERSSVVLAFGGGVVGDITGFAASAALRGIRYVQIPTTLLAMVDSSVGGKTAVDHARGKNLVGAFHQPSRVFVDTSFLDTLSDRDFLSGYAELFKNAFIGGPGMFDFVSKNHQSMVGRSHTELIEGITRSIRIKADVVEQDQFETSGLRAMLNFGHTFAHSLERFFGFETVLHGEAVFWGMRCACELGLRVKTINPSEWHLYNELLSAMPLPQLPSRPDPQNLYADMFSDKKVASGKIRFVLPAEPGRSVIRSDIPGEEVLGVLGSVFPG